MEVADIDKHSSLLRYGINYDRKKIYSTDPKESLKGEKINAALIYSRVQLQKTLFLQIRECHETSKQTFKFVSQCLVPVTATAEFKPLALESRVNCFTNELLTLALEFKLIKT